MATNRFVCEICNKGFQRDQNLQLHRRGHNLPWKLRQRTSKEIRKKVYICPEKSCVHHDPLRALGDLTGIKKHFSRKHGEKKWKCEKCSKKYAVQSDWKAHTKTCGTREYKCDCGTLFSRKDSFITHRAFCDALAEESSRFTAVTTPTSLSFRTTSDSLNGTVPSGVGGNPHGFVAGVPQFCPILRPEFRGMDANNSVAKKPRLSLWLDQAGPQINPIDSEAYNLGSSSSTTLPDLVQMASSSNLFDYGGSSVISVAPHHQWINRCAGAQDSTSAKNNNLPLSTSLKKEEENNNNNNNNITGNNMVESLASLYASNTSQSNNNNQLHMSATALLQKAAQMGATRSSPSFVGNFNGVVSSSTSSDTRSNSATTTTDHHHQYQFHQMFRQAVKQPAAVSSDHIPQINSTVGANADDCVLGGLNLSSLTDRANNNLDGLMMPPQQAGQPMEHSLTRDFLGVGGGGGDVSRPFLQQELVKFTSMGSAMDLSQYSAGSH
ncbi:hypothetical protein Syun_001027 [Stephania yunnanensis]|uniref:C2H2-type domain-containing protein n=1 Tax=Stephania yunnanensis TaxID=152371 RepID=A0AAP0LEQ7_9MAGN